MTQWENNGAPITLDELDALESLVSKTKIERPMVYLSSVAAPWEYVDKHDYPGSDFVAMCLRCGIGRVFIEDNDSSYLYWESILITDEPKD